MKKQTKSILCIAISIVLLLCGVLLCCCGNDGYAVMNVKSKAEVEFILDGDNKVVCATALNDDAHLALSGEDFVGLDLEEAIQLLLASTEQTCKIDDGGYIEFSVSGEQAQDIYEQAKDVILEFFADKSTDASVQFVKLITSSELQQLVSSLDCTSYLKQMHMLDDQQMIEYLLKERERMGQLCSQPLKELYLLSCDYAVDYKQKDFIANIIADVDEDARLLEDDYSYATTLLNYTDTLAAYQRAIGNVTQTMQESFFAPNCQYGQLFDVAIEAKMHLYTLIAEQEGASDGQKSSFEQQIAAAKQEYDQAVEALENCAQQISDDIADLIKIADNVGMQLTSLQRGFSQSLKDIIEDKQEQMENQLIDQRDDFINDFAEQYESDILAVKEKLFESKQNFIDIANGVTVDER